MGPKVLLASKASLMALEASGRLVLWRRNAVLERRNAPACFDADEAKASVTAGEVSATIMLNNFILAYCSSRFVLGLGRACSWC